MAVALLLTGCAKESANGGADGSRYGALFKLWVEPNSGHVLDMREARFGQVPYTVVSNGTTCECYLLVGGFIEFGTAEIRMCSLNKSQHPDCDAANSQYEYTLISGLSKMDLCKITQVPCATGMCIVKTCGTYL